jgi:hypothetical protein
MRQAQQCAAAVGGAVIETAQTSRDAISVIILFRRQRRQFTRLRRKRKDIYSFRQPSLSRSAMTMSILFYGQNKKKLLHRKDNSDEPSSTASGFL